MYSLGKQAIRCLGAWASGLLSFAISARRRSWRFSTPINEWSGCESATRRRVALCGGRYLRALSGARGGRTSKCAFRRPRATDASRRGRDHRLRTRSRSLTRVEGVRRSEEHTSELQSLRHLVCRLLLEKKNH